MLSYLAKKWFNNIIWKNTTLIISLKQRIYIYIINKIAMSLDEWWDEKTEEREIKDIYDLRLLFHNYTSVVFLHPDDGPELFIDPEIYNVITEYPTDDTSDDYNWLVVYSRYVSDS